MNRRSWLSAILLIGLLAAGTACEPVSPPPLAQFTVVFSSDANGHFDDCACRPYASGGFARLAAYLDKLRQGLSGRVLFVQGGDFLYGGPTGPEAFRPAAELHRRAGCEALLFGRRDYALGLAGLRELGAASGAALLGANVIDQQSGKRAWAETVLLDRGGARVGIFGVVAPPTGDAAKNAPWRQDVAFTDPTAVATRLVRQLRRQADVVILVANLHREELRAMLAKVRGIDFVLPSGEASELAERPETLRGTPVLPTLAGGRYVGRLDVTVIKPGKPYADQAERAMLERKIERFPRAASAGEWRRQLRELREPGNRYVYRLVELTDDLVRPPTGQAPQ